MSHLAARRREPSPGTQETLRPEAVARVLERIRATRYRMLESSRSVLPDERVSVYEHRADPVIAPTGISWTGGIGGRPLLVGLAFENPGDEPTRPTRAQVQVAAFGAFLPWQPVAPVAVPAILPGERRVVRTQMNVRTRAFRQLRAADGAQRAAALGAAESVRGAQWAFLDTHFQKLYEWIGDAQLPGTDAHWVGNINVFVDQGKPSERHIKTRIGLQPGVANTTMFCVGDGQLATYAFSIERCEPNWRVEMYGFADPRTGTGECTAPGVFEGEEGVLCAGRAYVGLRITPPREADTGSIAIHVKRRETEEETDVEFDLETAHGPAKCYFA